MYNFFSLMRNASNKNERAGKVDLSKLSDFPVVDYAEAKLGSRHDAFVFNFDESGHRYDFILSKKKDKKLFVIFSGSVNSKKLNLKPPVFQRWTWASRFPGSTLFISDPSLYLSENLSLSWYIGTKTVDHFDIISRVILEIAKSLGVSHQNIVGYGSSGGGFASLRMSAFIDGMTSVAINPQVIIKDYHEKSVNKFLKTCFKTSYGKFDFDKYEKRFDIRFSGINEVKNKIIVAQNIDDDHHYHNHFTPLCDKYGFSADKEITTSYFKTILFTHPAGRKRAHAKAETPEVFGRIMSMI